MRMRMRVGMENGTRTLEAGVLKRGTVGSERGEWVGKEMRSKT